jgi:AAA15 family ATPase/GTPase
MLIEFRVENFLSFEEMATLSMVATPDKEHEENNVLQKGDKLRLLKSAAIYGANSAGKSNLIKAMAFMSIFVSYGPRMSKKGRIPDFSFKLDKKDQQKPSFFEVTFLQNEKRFRYGFELSGNKVVSEWLFYTPTIREAILFTRDQKDGVVIGPSFKEARGLEAKPKDNQLFLNTVSGYNNEHSVSEGIVDWFRNLDVTESLDTRFYLGKILHLLDEHGDIYKEKMRSFLQKLDVLEDFEVRHTGHVEEFPDDMPEAVQAYLKSDGDEPVIIVKRKVYDNGKVVGLHEFDLLDDESEGTQKLFTLAGFFLDTLEHGGTLVVDELESNLHPLITRKVIELFNSAKDNPHGAQLVFATHDTNLLSNRLFRRDQIWFVEKNRQGASCLFSLAEYKEDGLRKARKDASFEKDYVLGRYGAIPFIGNFNGLLNGDEEDQ